MTIHTLNCNSHNCQCALHRNDLVIIDQAIFDISNRTFLYLAVDFLDISPSRNLGMEVCCTLGMLEQQQALKLKEAGLTAYNHNLDTSREYYPNVITTRTYDDRLETIKYVRDAGISVCSGNLISIWNIIICNRCRSP